MRLEEMEKWSRRDLRDRINFCLEHAAEVSGDDRSTTLTEAEFYMRGLEHRRDSWVSIRDFILEVIIIALIGWEIYMGYKQAAIQSTQFDQQTAIMSNLRTSSDETAQILITMNEHVEKELDLYYEPSVLITEVHQNGSDVLEVHNNARTRIAIFGIKGRNEVCSMERPLYVASFSTGVLDSAFVMNKVIRRVISSDANTPFTIYLKAEDGHKFKHDVLVVRLPIAEGAGVSFERQTTQPMDWGSELAERSVEKCPE